MDKRMDTIKYRAWDKEVKHMYYHPNHHISMGMNGIVVHMQTGAYLIPMLFIGSKDKYGIEIYGRDLMRMGKEVFKIVYSASLAQFVGDWGRSDFALSDSILSNAEVIGNIYEHPEIIKRNH